MKRNEANLHFLLHSAALVEDAVRRELLPLGLGPSQARVLDALDRMGPSSQVELAEECSITAASMSTMTMRLLAAGFVERRQDPDERRCNILRLSESGARLLVDVRAAWDAVDRVVEDAIGQEKAATIAELTCDLRNALGGRTPAARRVRRPKAEADAGCQDTEVVG